MTALTADFPCEYSYVARIQLDILASYQRPKSYLY